MVQFCRFLTLLQVSGRQRPEALLTAANGPFCIFYSNRDLGGGFSLPKGFQGLRWYGSHRMACAWHPHFPSRSTPPPPRSREPSAHVVTAGCASPLRTSCTRTLGPTYVCVARSLLPSIPSSSPAALHSSLRASASWSPATWKPRLLPCYFLGLARTSSRDPQNDPNDFDRVGKMKLRLRLCRK